MLRKFDIFTPVKKFFSTVQFVPEEFFVNGTKYGMRQATIEDIKSLIDIEKSVYHGETPWRKSNFYRELLSNQTHLYLVVFTANQPVAFAGIRIYLDDGHLTNIAVNPGFQNKSLGTRLLSQLISFAQAKECSSISLEVRKSNIDAQRFYRSLGFQSVKVKQNYYTDSQEDAIDMVKKV